MSNGTDTFLENIATDCLANVQVIEQRTMNGIYTGEMKRKHCAVVWSEIYGEDSIWRFMYIEPNREIDEHIPLLWIGTPPPKDEHRQKQIMTNPSEVIYIPIKKGSYDELYWLGRKIIVCGGVYGTTGWMNMGTWGLWVSSWYGETEDIQWKEKWPECICVWLGKVNNDYLPWYGTLHIRKTVIGSESLRWVNGKLSSNVWIPLAQWIKTPPAKKLMVWNHMTLQPPILGGTKHGTGMYQELVKYRNNYLYNVLHSKMDFIQHAVGHINESNAESTYNEWVKTGIPLYCSRYIYSQGHSHSHSHSQPQKFRTFTIKNMEWNNMSCYKNSSCIDLVSAGHYACITGDNQSGKSSIIDMIMFCLWEKTPRVNHIVDLVNKAQKYGFVRTEFCIDNNLYRLERFIEKKGKKSCTTIIKLEQYKENHWVKIHKNMKKDDLQDELVKSYIGTYEDFRDLNIFSFNHRFIPIIKSNSDITSILHSVLGLSKPDDKTNITDVLIYNFYMDGCKKVFDQFVNNYKYIVSLFPRICSKTNGKLFLHLFHDNTTTSNMMCGMETYFVLRFLVMFLRFEKLCSNHILCSLLLNDEMVDVLDVFHKQSILIGDEITEDTIELIITHHPFLIEHICNYRT